MISKLYKYWRKRYDDLYIYIFSDIRYGNIFGLRTDSDYYDIYKWIFRAVFIIGILLLIITNPGMITEFIKQI